MLKGLVKICLPLGVGIIPNTLFSICGWTSLINSKTLVSK
jgi:hypothetical protein